MLTETTRQVAIAALEFRLKVLQNDALLSPQETEKQSVPIRMALAEFRDEYEALLGYEALIADLEKETIKVGKGIFKRIQYLHNKIRTSEEESEYASLIHLLFHTHDIGDES